MYAKEQKQCDRDTIEKIGIPSLTLMERAALGVVEEAASFGCDLASVLVVCGPGNNGGDGFAAARILEERGSRVTLAFVGRESSMSKETGTQRQICENCGMKISSNFIDGEYTTIVDALFGIGLSRAVEGEYAEVIEWINRQPSARVSVDIPSGINADTGKVMGTAVRADLTVTFAYKKPGQLFYPGAEYCGKLVCRDIGIRRERLWDGPPSLFTYEKADLKGILQRPAYSNKGTFGKVLAIAGSPGMSGAACLCAEAAYRSGCGLVRVFTPACNRQIVQTCLPEAIVTAWEDKNPVEEALGWCSAAVVGPGLGKSRESKELLARVLRECRTPLVIDADGLNLLSENPELLKVAKGPVILTPHIGEMARLTGRKKEEILDDLVSSAKEFAKTRRVICVLKDARTVVSDGEQVCINCSGNSGMATGGSGDVLAGMIAGLLAGKMEPFKAASFGAYLHGLAGDLAKEKLGACGMLAGDIVKCIGTALRDTNAERQQTG